MDNIDMDEKVVDDVFNDEHLKLPKQLLSVIGFWPYEVTFGNKIRQFITYSVCASVVFPFIMGTRMWCGVNLENCIENIVSIIFTIGIMIKALVTTASTDKMKVLFKIIAKNRLTLTDPEERKILLKYAKLGHFRAFIYFAYCVSGALAFYSIPLLTVLLDYVKPLNESREKIEIVKGDFFVNKDENYYNICMYLAAVATVYIFVVGGIDGCFTVITHQSLAIMAIVILRLQTAAKTANGVKDSDYFLMIKAITLHKESIEFNELVNKSYSIVYLLINGVTVIYISLGSLIIIHVLDDFKKEDILELFRYCIMALGILIHMFYFSWPGQMLIDHGEDLYRSISMIQWYNISPEGKELLKILLLRLTKPMIFTAYGLFDINFENFGMIIKTTLSYITVAFSTLKG